MVQETVLKAIVYENEATKNRSLYAAKRYATDGKNIPFKKNWSETWCTLSVNYDKCLDRILKFEVRDKDVFLVTFMKSGTTWMQECAWLLLNNLDFEKSKETAVMIRSAYLDCKGFSPHTPDHLERAQTMPSPRLLKDHLPANLLPLELWEKKQKTIYVARNVKDVIISSFHFMKNIGHWQGHNFTEYVEDFLNNEIVFTPYWPHVIDFWRMRHESFIFFVTYEEMQRDLPAVLQRLCCFLDRPQLSKEELEKTVEYLSFDSMKKHKNTNMTYLVKDIFPGVKEDFQFMRRGIVGSYKDEMTPELIAKIDKWSADSLGQYGLKEEDIFGKY